MKMIKKMAAVMGTMGIAGYMYLKKHPEIINNMKKTFKETSKKMYYMFDDEL